MVQRRAGVGMKKLFPVTGQGNVDVDQKIPVGFGTSASVSDGFKGRPHLKI